MPCSCYPSRYRRSVMKVYPDDPAAGLDPAGMQQLTFYALTHPERLPKITRFLAGRIQRDVVAERTQLAVIGVQAFDSLLQACHSSLSLFAVSLLRVVEMLLDAREHEFQIIGTNTFIKFAHIEEDTPSYRGDYSDFLERFSAMSWRMETPDLEVRLAGLRGLRAVIRKTVDSRYVNLWEQRHMDMVVPPLLANMDDAHPGPDGDHHDEFAAVDAADTEQSPKSLAVTCLKDLLSRASFGNIKSFLQPVFRHLDNFDHWQSGFMLDMFRTLLKLIQDQYAHVVVGELLVHLEQVHQQRGHKAKAGIIEALQLIVEIAAGGAMGPAVMDVFNQLLRHLRSSISEEPQTAEVEVGTWRSLQWWKGAILHTPLAIVRLCCSCCPLAGRGTPVSRSHCQQLSSVFASPHYHNQDRRDDIYCGQAADNEKRAVASHSASLPLASVHRA
eukprot:m.92533 g.92533  ORF g.92533 m.92533 type:complete len:443 (+) comp15070_c0_seq4:278-1606(+)